METPPEQAPGPEAGNAVQRREARGMRADTKRAAQRGNGGTTDDDSATGRASGVGAS